VKLQATSQRLLQAAGEAKLSKARGHPFWSSSETVERYGPLAKVYSMMRKATIGNHLAIKHLASSERTLHFEEFNSEKVEEKSSQWTL
jgi:hypothetical protein